ncbi:hypothetical protein BDB01DRAFT_844086 [Pilobolus umbonatus]|nr:hypothetical protein BDB01DRAFT_844086 [Pilobolus umbonatus]
MVIGTLPKTVFKSIVVDASSTTVPESTDPIIEFIGHDLTIGIHTSQSLFTSYAWLTSQLLGTEPQIIAYKEATLIAGIEKSYFDWSPSTHQKAWGIVVLLGSNDFQHTEEEYRISCTAFLSNVRKTLRPEDPIFVLSEPLGDMFRPSQQSVIDLSAIDSSLYFIDTTAWIRYGSTYYRDYGHLTDMGHSLLAKKLAPLLQLKLNYPRQPLPGPAPNPNLPGDWQTMDIGEDNRIGLPGTVSADSGSTFTLWGSGADIDNEKDAFRFVYQPFSNQGVIESTVRSHSAFAKCAKAGIMIREHFGHGSPLIMLGISPADGVFIQVRYHNFGPTKLIKKMRASPPYRLRLIRLRESGLFEAQIQQIDSNGNTNTWETFSRIPFILARDVYAGLAVTSCDVSVVSVAKFTEVNLQHSSFGGLNTPRLIEQYS